MCATIKITALKVNSLIPKIVHYGHDSRPKSK